jgi:hypothetical protein
MAQIAELNDRLNARATGEILIAADLDLQGVAVVAPGQTERQPLPGQAILEDLCYDGPPEFPYIHAHFQLDPSEPGSVTVDLHTESLRKLGRLLHVREIWGVGSAENTQRRTNT